MFKNIPVRMNSKFLKFYHALKIYACMMHFLNAVVHEKTFFFLIPLNLGPNQPTLKKKS